MVRVFQTYTSKNGSLQERYFGHVRTTEEADILAKRIGLIGKVPWGVHYVTGIELETGQIITNDDILGTRKFKKPYIRRDKTR